MRQAPAFHPTLVDEAVRVLRESILDGQLRPEQRIRLAEVAGQLQMSPIPVREALRILSQDGLVELVPRRGYRVQAVSFDDFEDTYAIRKELESFAIDRAVNCLTSENVAALRAILVRMEEATSADDFALRLTLHREFHFGLYGLAGSKWLERFLPILWDNSERYQRLQSRTRITVVEEHRQILEAVRSGDAEAAKRILREHLEHTEESVRKILSKSVTSKKSSRRSA